MEQSRLDKKQRAGCFFLDKSSYLPSSNPERVLFLFQLEKVLFKKNKQTKTSVTLVKIYNGTSLLHSSGEGFSATKKYGSKITNHSPLV